MSISSKILSPSGLGRRQLLLQISAALGVAALPGSLVAAGKPTVERWVSARGDGVEAYGLGWLPVGDASTAGAVLTGFRGHGMMQHPTRPDSIVLIARRPGTRGLEIDVASGEVVASFDCAPDRHLLGHGCFSADGSVLFTTEAAISVGEGRVAVRDAHSYVLLDEWGSHGVGPHDIHLMPDGKRLVIANGGILTRPESGRRGLNLDTMQSNLSYLDAESGSLLDVQRVAEPKSSIRHLDVAADGTVAFAIQVQREAMDHNEIVPLAGVHQPGEAVQLFEGPDALMNRLRDYTGSVAICEQSRLAGYTSPHGSLAVFWNIDDGELAGYHRLFDVCGIAATPGRAGFVLSNSLGEMRELDGYSLQERRDRRVKTPGNRWDNHLLIAGAT